MLKPRKAKTGLAIVTRYPAGLRGFPEGFAVYLGKKLVRYIDGVEVGEIVGPLASRNAAVFTLPKTTRVIYRTLQDGFCRATIGMGAKYYGLRKLPQVAKKKGTYMEELQESLFGKPDYSHIGINAKNDEGNTSTMDKLFKGGIHNGDDRLKRKIANNPGVSGAFDNRVAGLLQQGTGHSLLTSDCRSIRTIALQMAQQNIETAMRKLNFSNVTVLYTTDVLKDVENELRTCHDDRNHINRMLELRKTLPLAGTYTLVDDLVKLPLMSQLTESICAAGKRAMAELSTEDATELDDPTPETLVDWLILFGSLNQPKTLDYLSTLNVGDSGISSEETAALYKRIRERAGINDGDEAVARTVAMARAISPHLHDPYAYSRALRNGEPVLYMDLEMPMDTSKLKDMLVKEEDVPKLMANYLKVRQAGKGEMLTLDSIPRENSLLKDEDDNA
ncbi:hypothetical protein FDI85_gp141 [Erwinia phage Machina]|uniref:Uncharacterized protein n=1 Tax=Erwinia phage Machina TaxID=1883375 RepID=A0A1B2IES9_9CAUD|nr:hypothetical protein FDI85_gp141 [Erwinia phage Machina]ANZ49781.1 hypothetical protein MACHINA_143 [Erwinia phage Machina]